MHLVASASARFATEEKELEKVDLWRNKILDLWWGSVGTWMWILVVLLFEACFNENRSSLLEVDRTQCLSSLYILKKQL